MLFNSDGARTVGFVSLTFVSLLSLSACSGGGNSNDSTGNSTNNNENQSNNTSSTTYPVDTIDSKPALPSSDLKKYVFKGDDGSQKAWITDGTAANTKPLRSDAKFLPNDPDLQRQTSVGGHVIFSAKCDAGQCWAITDGTESGTKFVMFNGKEVQVSITPQTYDVANKKSEPSKPVLFRGSYHLMSKSGKLLKFRADGQAISLASISSAAEAEDNCGIHQMEGIRGTLDVVPSAEPRGFGKHITFAGNLFISIGFRHYHKGTQYPQPRRHVNLYRYDPSVNATCKMKKVVFQDADGTNITNQVNQDSLHFIQSWFEPLNGKQYAHFVTKHTNGRQHGHLYEYNTQKHIFKRIAINATVNGQSENINRYDNAMNWVQLSDKSLVGVYDHQNITSDTKRYLVRFNGNTAEVANIRDSSGTISTANISASRRDGWYSIMVHNDKIILREKGTSLSTHLIKVDPSNGNATRIAYGSTPATASSFGNFEFKAKLKSGVSILKVKRDQSVMGAHEIWYLNDNQVGLTKEMPAPAPVSGNRFGRIPTVLGISADNSKLLFAANTTSHGKELWYTDGSSDPSGTNIVKEIKAGTGDGVIY